MQPWRTGSRQLDAEHPLSRQPCWQTSVSTWLQGIEVNGVVPVLSLPLCWLAAWECHREAEVASPHETLSERWQEVIPLQGTFWKRVQERSHFQHRRALQIFELLAQHGWELTAEFSSLLQDHWCCISQTKLVEDGIRDQRVGEQRSSFNNISSGECTWKRLLGAETDSDKHRFLRVPFEEADIPRNMVSRSAAGLFKVMLMPDSSR